MKITKKHLFNGLWVATALATAAHVRADQITWTEDSTSAFDVTITGVLGDNSDIFGLLDVPITSPSGLWQIEGEGDELIYSPESPTPWTAQGGQQIDYLGTPLPAIFNGSGTPMLDSLAYHEPQEVIPSAENEWEFGSLHDRGGWTGGSVLTINFDPDDIAASTWTDNFHASGPDLDVPDSGPTVALFGLSLIVLFTLRRRMVF